MILVALAIFVAAKWWDRRRFYNELRMARVSVEELAEMPDAGTAPMILDVRSTASQTEDGRSRAIAGDEKTIAIRLPDDNTGREVIVYCACPNEAWAARIQDVEGARLHACAASGWWDRGWIDAGYAIER